LYDVITVDPAPPVHSAGTVNLYAREFFELCKARLTPGGVFCLWLPPAAESEALMILRSFFAVFPEGALWGGHEFQGFYLVGGHRPMRQTPEQIAALAEQLSRIEDLGEWDPAFRSPEVLKGLYITDAAGLKPLLANVPDVTDDRPYTEFPLWRQLWHPAGQRPFTADVLRERLGQTKATSASP
jgi:spermidine synthase